MLRYMATELWFRNVLPYQHQLIQCGVRNWAMHRAYTLKKRVEPLGWARTHLPSHWDDWRMLHIGDQGSAEYRAGQKGPDPVAVYPTWHYGSDPLSLLLWMLDHPAGEYPGDYIVPSMPTDTRPVEGQEHRVVIIGIPDSTLDKSIMPTLQGLQADFPEAKIHLSGKSRFNDLFGRGFAAADYHPYDAARIGTELQLPNGRTVRSTGDDTRWDEHATWINLLGFRTSELQKPKKRCLFLIRSAQWAAQHWDERIAWRSRRDRAEVVDYETPEAHWKASVVKNVLTRRRGGADTRGDMIACDMCSLAADCRAYRQGSVCNLPNSTGSELAQLFGSDNVDQILAGMRRTMVHQADRAEQAIKEEAYSEEGGLDPEVTKILDGLFNKGEKMVKLLDPKRFAKPALTINNQNVQLERGAASGSAAAGTTDAQTLTAKAIGQLESAGWERAQITRDVVEEVMRTGQAPAPPIELTTCVEVSE